MKSETNLVDILENMPDYTRAVGNLVDSLGLELMGVSEILITGGSIEVTLVSKSEIADTEPQKVFGTSETVLTLPLGEDFS